MNSILLLILMLNGFECLSYEDDVDFGYFEGKLISFLIGTVQETRRTVHENLENPDWSQGFSKSNFT